MNTILKRILGASLALAAFSFITPSHVLAQTCITPPTCESLGYTMTEADCEGYNFLKCPFDTSFGYCSSDSGGSSEKCNTPSIGDYLYSDMSCSATLDKSKTVIGIIFDDENRLAIALDTERRMWSNGYFDIPGLRNWSTNSRTSDWSGKSNTKKIIDYCRANNKSCPAAEYAYSYTTEGTQAGDWYLLSAGELQAIYDNRDVLNLSLSSAGERSFNRYDNYWSSSEFSYYDVWGIEFIQNDDWSPSNSDKKEKFYVRPVIQF